MNKVKEISFSGLSGSYIKNNIKHKFNLKQSNLVLEVIGIDNTYKLDFYKNLTHKYQKIKTIDEVQDVFIDKISEDSEIILDAKKIFNIKSVIRGNGVDIYPYIRIGEIARVVIDKMSGGLICIKNSKTNNNPRAVIKAADKLIVQNQHNDKIIRISSAKNMTLSDSELDEKILISAEKADLTFDKEFDILA